jgi:radical SAM protein with 4Fe4S-binding SPASM domain
MRTIFWEVTARCNLRCKHCYLHEELTTPSAEPGDELGTEECLNIVDQFDEANVFYVGVLGGEPFCRPDIMDILRYMGEKKFWTRVTTNGTLIDETIARDLADIGVKGLFVSLEGPHAEINDAIRGTGSFKKAVKGINYLRDFGIPFEVQMTVNKINYDRIDEMMDFCLKIGAGRVIFSSFDDLSSNKEFSSFMRLGREEFFSAAQKIAEFSAEYPEGLITNDMSPALRFCTSDPDPTATNGKFIRCDLGSTQLAVLNNGDVIPCKYMRDIIFGNLMETHLLDIPDLPAFKKFKELRDLTIDEANEQCRACEWRYVCGGGCRGRAYLKHGDLLAPDPHMCLLARGKLYD